MEIVEVDLGKEYNIEGEFLDNNLFIQDGNLGAYCKSRSFLNINLLPNFFVYLKSMLDSEEKGCINEYTLQNFLIELSTIKLVYNTLPILTDYVLNEIRNNYHYWIQNSPVYLQIQSNTKELKLQQEIENSNQIQNEQNNDEQINDEQNKSNNQIETDKKDNIDENIDNNNEMDDQLKLENETRLKQIEWQKRQEIEKVEKYREYQLQMYLTKQSYNIILNKEEEQIQEPPIESLESSSENLEMPGVEIIDELIEEENKRVTRGQVNKIAQLSYTEPQKVKSIQTKRIRKSKYASEQSLFLNVDQQKKNSILPLQVLPYLYSYLLPKDQSQKNQFRLQNLLMYFMFQEGKVLTGKHKQKENLFSTDTLDEPECGYLGEQPIMQAFRQHCLDSDNILIAHVLQQDSSIFKYQLTLLNNLLLLGVCYLKEEEIEHIGIELTGCPSGSVLTCEQRMSMIKRYRRREREQESIHQIELEIYCHIQQQKHQEYPCLASMHTQKYLDTVCSNYVTLMDNTDNRERREYKFHSQRQIWPKALFFKFMQALALYQDHTINNKKIAWYMGDDTKPNHVKYVKGMFIRHLKKKAKANRVLFRQQLQTDIERFDYKEYLNIIDIE